nr:hypothetical protein CFP56_12081 [Quercus suber]
MSSQLDDVLSQTQLVLLSIDLSVLRANERTGARTQGDHLVSLLSCLDLMSWSLTLGNDSPGRRVSAPGTDLARAWIKSRGRLVKRMLPYVAWTGWGRLESSAKSPILFHASSAGLSNRARDNGRIDGPAFPRNCRPTQKEQLIAAVHPRFCDADRDDRDSGHRINGYRLASDRRLPRLIDGELEHQIEK